ncbi:MAG: hypothetical protein QI223_08070 [Candidatus Korarchaeota archaeon]|nr:hypothetical protein [Candidatus Korarchaeota archaeon]
MPETEDLPPGFRWVREGDLTYLSYEPPRPSGASEPPQEANLKPILVSDHGYGTYLIVDPYDGNLYHAGGPSDRAGCGGRSRNHPRVPYRLRSSSSLVEVIF